jgi:hypothetical protein
LSETRRKIKPKLILNKPFGKYHLPSVFCYAIIVGLLSINTLPILEMFSSNNISPTTYGIFDQALAQRPVPDGPAENRRSDGAGFSRYQDTSLGFSVAFPSYGEAKELEGGVMLTYGPIVTTVAVRPNVGMSLERYTDTSIEQLRKDLDNIQIVRNQIEQGETSGYEDEYFYFTMGLEGSQLFCVYLNTIAQDTGYDLMTCSNSEVAEESSSILEYIVNSFEILERSSAYYDGRSQVPY